MVIAHLMRIPRRPEIHVTISSRRQRSGQGLQGGLRYAGWAFLGCQSATRAMRAIELILILTSPSLPLQISP